MQRLVELKEQIGRFRKTLALILIVVTLTVLLTTLISMWLARYDNMHFPSIGTIQTMGVEAYGGDIKISPGSAGAEYVDWGTIYPGASVNRSFYVRSVSNRDIKLNFTATNWTPSNMANYMNLTSNYSETALNPNEAIFVTLTLSTPDTNQFIDYLVANNVRSFSFDIHIRPLE